MKLPGTPTEEVLEECRSFAFIECDEQIPCNPCEVSCPQGAIYIGKNITDLPVFDHAKCIGCNLCIAKCPGLAIFVINGSYSDKEALVSLPYELLPLPKEGEKVIGLDREGNNVCSGIVVSVKNKKNYDHTAIISVRIPKKHRLHVRHIKLK